MLMKAPAPSRNTWGYIEPDRDFCDRQYGEAMTHQEAGHYWRLPEAERDAYKKSIKKGKYSKCYAPE